MDGTDCKNCINNCDICINNTSCDDCSDGYYYFDSGCVNCVTNCQICSNENTCT